jgi:hypothetical protein
MRILWACCAPVTVFFATQVYAYPQSNLEEESPA